MRKNLPAIGQSYTHDDLPLSAQATRNWYPEVNIETTVTVSLQPFPGAEMFSAGTAGDDRGVTFWNGNLYKVTGEKLYKINQAGMQTYIGPILGANRCTFPASLQFLVIVTSGYAYQYEAATLLLTRITDVDLEPPNYGAYLNNQWIYQGTDARFAVSDAGIPSSVNGLNYATAESDGDPLVRPYVYLQTLYLFGTASIESYYNSGVGTPPFDRIESGIIPTGLGAADSLAHNDNYLYFVGDDRLVYQMQGYQVRPISTIPIAQAFESYASISDAVGFCFTWKGQYFYQVSAGGVTWCFNETAGGWFELTVGTDETPHPATAYVYAYGKHLIAEGGNLLAMGGELYNGQPVIRERITGLISGELLGEEMIGRPLFMSRCEIIIKGTPPLGVTPQIMLSWSDDAGYTYSNERIIECGSLGNYTFKAVADQLGRFYDRVFKIRISDENSYSLHRMSGDIDGGY